MPGGLADQPDLNLGRALLRPSACEVLAEGQRLVLEPQVMRALLVLAERPGQVVSRQALVDGAWDGRAVSEDAINRVISRIRRLAAETGAFDLSTQRKVGWRLEVADPSEPAPPAVEAGREPARRAPPVWALLLAALLAAVAGLGAWRLLAPRPVEVSSLAVAPLRAETPALTPEAAHLTADLQTTLSHMQGLSLVDAQGGARPPDLVLSGTVSPDAPQSAVSLVLTDRRSGARVWAARFDAHGVTDPTVRERALSAAARYLAIWLGDRVRGAPAAREPEDPEVTRMIHEARQTLSAAHQARHNRDWATFARLVRQTQAAQARVLALDPESSAALMLGYQVEGVPAFPRPDETEADYAARRQRAAQLLARALAANPDDPDALAATARDYTYALRWEEAETLYARAVAIDPNSPDANTWYAYALATSGRCEAALRHARIAAGLMPGDSWRQMAVPRMQHCAGRTAEAAKGYRALLTRDPGNVFVLHDLYLMLLGARDAKVLRGTADEIAASLWRGRPPTPVAAQLDRMRLAADALEGRPQGFLTQLRAEDRALADPGGVSGDGEAKFGSSWGDQAFVLAFEYAQAGERKRALELLRGAVNAGSLYLPWALPFGAHEFPPAIRADPAYGAIWRSSPGVAELIARRKAAKDN